MEVIIVHNESSVIERLWNLIKKSANAAIQENSVFRIGLSGGSLIKYLANGAENAKTDWSKWQLYFCDERFVDESDEDSTFGQYKKLFLPKTQLTESQFVIINRSLSLKDCAKDYEQQIFDKFGIAKPEIPQFDLLLLGMGPDGHTCSLFPGHPLLKEEALLIAPISDSPKPPPARVTMTYPLINQAKVCLFPISGKGKAEMIKRILKEKEQLPAGLVKPSPGALVWLLDQDAASLYA
ncbi:6-phosphogluconolactonase [Sitodiplosis mosellana]|uniref:6-phosphogluconolactonase n=1 Tax=Sitodiplosis mosellana TaxID=263140 RepID=UPI002444FF8C|nr:6-phosphogluconolactonase [Sitodiplosis mosellana]